jgi:hypothetical protein
MSWNGCGIEDDAGKLPAKHYSNILNESNYIG